MSSERGVVDLTGLFILLALLHQCNEGCALSTEASMPREQELRPVGLVTDPNAYSEMPKGALSEANNVVIRRKGLVEPRPGQVLNTSFSVIAGLVARRLFPHDGDLLSIAADASDSAMRWVTADVAAVDEDGNRLKFDPLRISGIKARDNLYINASSGTYKLTAAGDAVAERAGILPPILDLDIGPTTGSAFDPETQAVYRATVSREDANGVVVTSQPTSRQIVRNESATDSKEGGGSIRLMAEHQEGDIVRLYRSKTGSLTAMPDDELALVVEHKVTSSNISLGGFGIDDDVADADRGAFLYTSPSQEGIEEQNTSPHQSKDLAFYRDSVFYLNTTGPHRVTVKYTPSYDVSGSSSGIGYRSVTGDLTDGSNVIDSVSDTTGLEVGQLVDNPAKFDGSGTVRITSIPSSSQVEVSENASTTSAGESLRFNDSIRVGDLYYSVATPVELMVGMGSGKESSVNRAGADPDRWAYTIGTRVSSSSEPEEVTVVIEERLRGDSAFDIHATHGDEYFPPLNATSSATGEESTNDHRPSGFQWSKRDQPEHVPEANFELAGDDPILKAVPTKDAMFIFTEGGIWRLTGVGEESGWRIDPFDLSHKLLTPACAVVMQGTIYAWTNHGVVRVTDMGVSESVSAPISNLLSQIERDLATYSTDTPGAWMAANDKDNEILLGVPASTGDDAAEKIYVLNTKTGAWTTWDGAYNHAVLDPSDSLLRFAKMNSTTLEVYKERGETLLNTVGSEDDYDAKAADAAFEPIVSSVSSDNVVTLSSTDGWTPEVGDMVHKEFFDPAIVIAVTSSTEFTVDSDAAQSYGTGSVDAYKHFDSSVKYRSVDGGDPSTRKHYREAIAQWEELRGVHEWTMGWTSEISDTEVTQDVEYTRTRHATGPQPKRLFVPRDHGRVSRLRPKITVSQAGGQWQFAGMSFRFDPMSSRVRGSL